jgi:hypothetical protein
MITQDQLREVIGSTAHDSSGDKVGKVGHVYCDDETDQPKWLTVHTGLFGGNETFVPMQGADIAHDGRVTVAYDKAMVKDAPSVDEDGHLSVEDEQQLVRRRSTRAPRVAARRASTTATERSPARTAGRFGHDTSGPATSR